MLTLLCLIIPTTGLCSVFIFRHKTQTWWHHETGLTGLRHDSFKFWDGCRLLVILKYLLLLWLPGWLADWLWQSDVILCHQLYAAPPKYGIGIKGLPSACVCEHLLLFYSWSTDRRSNQTKPTYQTNWCRPDGSESGGLRPDGPNHVYMSEGVVCHKIWIDGPLSSWFIRSRPQGQIGKYGIWWHVGDP